jgi:protein AATF/BFR2
MRKQRGQRRILRDDYKNKESSIPLSEQLAALTDPTPIDDKDPEEPYWDSNINYDNYEEQDFSLSLPKGFKDAPIKRTISKPVSDIIMGPEYRGKRSSRQAFCGLEVNESDKPEPDYEMNEPVNNNEEYRPSFPVNLNESSSDVETKESEEDLSDMSESEHEEPILSNTERQKLADKYEEELVKEEEEKVLDLKTIESQRKKAEHTMNQRIMWDALLDFRINFQNILDNANRLPAPKDRSGFINLENDDLNQAYTELQGEISGLVDDFNELHQKIIAKDSLVHLNDLHLNSETNWDSLQHRQQKIEEVINSMLDQWQSKVMPVSARRTFKLKTINQSIHTQVEGTLSGRNYSNILRRSQAIPEESGKIFGEPTDNSIQTLPEIYNDGDFYSQLIKERLQSGLSAHNPSNPLEMSQQYLKLQQLQKRKKKKKLVDTKASKGRRIRYNVHDKLVSFMAAMVRRDKF